LRLLTPVYKGPEPGHPRDAGGQPCRARAAGRRPADADTVALAARQNRAPTITERNGRSNTPPSAAGLPRSDPVASRTRLAAGGACSVKSAWAAGPGAISARRPTGLSAEAPGCTPIHGEGPRQPRPISTAYGVAAFEVVLDGAQPDVISASRESDLQPDGASSISGSASRFSLEVNAARRQA